MGAIVEASSAAGQPRSVEFTHTSSEGHVVAPIASDSGPIRLTEWTTCGGCAAKWGAASLRTLLTDLSAGAPHGDLLVGLAPFDDAAVYRLTDEVALVSTTDFFPPVVDDPADFGAIAAANACSDIFAMGARVVLALNVAAFPERLPPDVVDRILAAAREVVAEAGGVVAGGHTIRSDEPIFGLAVQGVVDPRRVWTKTGARPGDALVLSKPVGTGIVLAGGDDAAKQSTTAVMRRLNRAAADELHALPEGLRPHAVTDVTGFGLLGHGWEIAERSGVVLRFEATRVPLYEGALEAAGRGVRTGGDARNRDGLAGHFRIGPGVDEAIEALCFDPQTSGGLLAAVPPEAVDRLPAFTRVGDVHEGAASVALV